MARPLPPTPDYYGGLLLPQYSATDFFPDFILPADVGFTHGSAWYSRAIRWATRHSGEPPTYANHTFGFGRDLSIVEALTVVTATSHTAWRLPDQFEIFRRMRISLPTRRYIARDAESWIGNPYGAVKIIPHLLDGLVSKLAARNVRLFRRLCFIPDYPICSWLWAWAYARFGHHTAASSWRYASPDDQHDYMTGQGSGTWALVMKRFPDGAIVAWNDSTGYPQWQTSANDTGQGSSRSRASVANS